MLQIRRLQELVPLGDAPGASRLERRHDQVYLRRSPAQLPQGHRLLRRHREAGGGKAEPGRNSDWCVRSLVSLLIADQASI